MSEEELQSIEQKELLRLCAQRILDNAAFGIRVPDAGTRQWAEFIVRHNKPLQRPLGPGPAQLMEAS